jgi:hypothetical protein
MRISPTRWIAAFTPVALVASLGAQTPARDARVMPTTGTASVVGTVVSDDGSNQPIRGATVTISTKYNEVSRLGVTDDDGQFVIDGLPAGDFFVRVTKPGYVAADPVRKQRLPALPLTLVDGDRQTMAFRMMRGAAISLRVLDDYGRPRAEVQVQAIKTRLLLGQRVNDLASGSIGASYGRTNDAGACRFFGLAPGDYVISATTGERPDIRPVTQAEVAWAQQLARSDGQSIGTTIAAPAVSGPMASPAAYYPGVTDLSAATVITLAAGEEREGLDFSLPSVPTSRIAGTVVDASGRPASGVQVSLLNTQPPRPSNSGIPASRTDAAGAFHFYGQLPGTYTLAALARASSAASSMPTSSSWARQTVSVNGNDLTDIALQLQPTVSVSGRIVLDTATGGDPAQLLLYLIPPRNISQVMAPMSRPNADGTFVFRDLIPDRYSLDAGAQTVSPPSPAGTVAMFPVPTRWIATSVIVNGVETIDTGIDLSTADVTNMVATLSDRRTELSGMLVDATNRPIPQFGVVAFSVGPADATTTARRIAWATTDAQGAFKISLSAGEYYLAPIIDMDAADFAMASLLKFELGPYLDSLVPKAIRITIAFGEQKTQNLKLSGGLPR